MTTPTDEAALRRKDWVNGAAATPRRRCPRCGAAFHTRVGLDEHARVGCGNGAGSPVRVRRTWRHTEARRAAMSENGRAVTALNNSRRVRCDTCGLISTPSGVGTHQAFIGHVGRTEVSR